MRDITIWLNAEVEPRCLGPADSEEEKEDPIITDEQRDRLARLRPGSDTDDCPEGY